MPKTAKLDGKNIPYEDILQMQMRFVSDEKVMEIRYREFDPVYHETVTLLPYEKGYELEKKIRKACNR